MCVSVLGSAECVSAVVSECPSEMCVCDILCRMCECVCECVGVYVCTCVRRVCVCVCFT